MTRRQTAAVLGLIVFALLVLGIVMLASASSVRAETYYYDAQHFLKRQSVALILALLAGGVACLVEYRSWRRWMPWALGAAVVLLILVLIPGIGRVVARSRRWLPPGFQPSEIAKLAVVGGLAYWMTELGPKKARTFTKGFVVPVAALGFVVLLILLEPDLGTAALVGIVGLAVLYEGGSRLLYLGAFVAVVVLSICALYLLIRSSPTLMADPRIKNRIERIEGFSDPSGHPGIVYQARQAREAFRAGGWTGVGLGKSLHKRFYLPEAHTDCILAIIGEELGLAATIGVVLFFLGFLMCGMNIAYQAPDAFSRHLAFGITLLLSLQAAVNIGVVTDALPAKGLPLPFISYGGSSLVVSVFAVGMLISIGRAETPEERIESAIQDREHWV